jgi:predicted PurR-regulated permease PerM
VLVAALVLLALVVAATVLWKIRLVLFLLLLAIVIAAAMRPGVEALQRRRIPRAAGIALHYVVVAAIVAALLGLAVPRALSEVRSAVGSIPQAANDVEHEAKHSTGLKHEVLVGVERRLEAVPSRGELVGSGVELTRGAFEALVAVFFVLAGAAYWLSERGRVEHVLLALLPRERRETAHATWELIDLKLGAFVRGQLLLVLVVGTVLSLAFWAIGLPYWLLIGTFAGIVELVPLVGPLVAGAVAIGAGLTVSVTVAVAAGLIVLAVRLLEDTLVMPRVIGDAVGLSPLLVLVMVSASGVVLGGLAVLVAIPIAAVLVTLLDVLVLHKDPTEAEVPAVIFSASDSEAS